MNPTSFSKTAKLLHWLMAIIWIAVWCMGILAVYGRAIFNPNYGLTYWHKAIASTLLFLVVIRIICRLIQKAPLLPSSMSAHAQKIAKIGLFILYLLPLLAMPISGWFMSSVVGSPIMVLGLFELPALTAKNPDLVPLAKNTHISLAFICIVLIVGHILMALKHHYIDRDNVLKTMLPFSKE